LVGTLALLSLAATALIYRQEGHDIGTGFRGLLVGLRVGTLLLLFLVFLPQLRMHFERQGWPDVVILIDDSFRLNPYDSYRDGPAKTAADALAKKAELTDAEKAELARALGSRTGLTSASRLRLAQTFLAGNGEEWLHDLLMRRKVRLH